MKVLLIGAGGREHALAWKIAASPLLTRLICAPGNPGMEAFGERRPVGVDDLEGLLALALEIPADLVVVGPEAPLALGLADRLAALGVLCFGPSRAAAQLETSKGFLKDFADRRGLPTARYLRVADADALGRALDQFTPPYVVKADGLAAGKGVVLAPTRAAAEAAAQDMLAGRLGAAGRRLVIEEFLPGEEASLFALCDGETLVPFGGAQDHKRAFEGEMGPNTGGMGAYSPAPILTPRAQAAAEALLLRPTLEGMAEEGTPFRGALFAGLMIEEDRPSLIEYNVRFGDPECQALMMRLESDLLPYLHGAAAGGLRGLGPPRFSADASICVVLAAEGYPETPRLGDPITGLAEAQGEGVMIFQAGVRRAETGALVSAGGRVLNVCAAAPTLAEARGRALEAIARIRLPGGRWRRDIGWRALSSDLADPPETFSPG